MPAEPGGRDRAWAAFDRIVAAARDGGPATPWVSDPAGARQYRPDFDTLAALLGVPLALRADSRTGVPALAFDVWMSHELRRAGFDPDATWPRAAHPRILPGPIASLLRSLPGPERTTLAARLGRKQAIDGVTAASATILGKNYPKQVDVVISDWSTGPELLISTKRMDSSYGKNAANRVEESYGDAKNLRLRHPLAALGFLFGVRSDILTKEPRTFEWLVDLLVKLGREDDAYHATALVVIEYSDAVAVNDDAADPANPSIDAGLAPDPAVDADRVPMRESDHLVERLPPVRIRHDSVPEELSAARFLATMVDHVLDTTPVNFHIEARRRRRAARAG